MMKWNEKKGLYLGSNVSFDPASCVAKSYDYWIFVARIQGQVVFNEYNFSPTTRAHQRKVERLLGRLRIKIDHRILAPKGLQNLQASIYHYENKIALLEAQIALPRSYVRKNEDRLREVVSLSMARATVQDLMEEKSSHCGAV